MKHFWVLVFNSTIIALLRIRFQTLSHSETRQRMKRPTYAEQWLRKKFPGASNDEIYDACMEALLRFVEKAPISVREDETRTRKWVYFVAKNILILTLKHKHQASDNEIEYSDYDATQDEVHQALTLDLETAFHKVPYQLAATFDLYMKGYTMQEIAELQMISVEAVKKRIQRTRSLLKSLLE